MLEYQSLLTDDFFENHQTKVNVMVSVNIANRFDHRDQKETLAEDHCLHQFHDCCDTILL